MKPPIDIAAEQARARAAGVVREENLPFLLPPAEGDGRSGILLVHGLTASPHEMRPLADYLAGKDAWVYGLRLPGHGTSPLQLANTCQVEWQAEVNRGLRFLHANCRQCFGVGMSTGGLLLLAATAVVPCHGLALLSPFLRLRHRLAPFAGLLKHWIPYQERPLPEDQQPFYYQQRPLAAIAELNRLIRRLKHLLPHIALPLLILSAEADETVDPTSAEDLFHRLGSSQKSRHSYPAPAPHVLCSEDNPFREDCFTRIGQFLASCSDKQR